MYDNSTGIEVNIKTMILWDVMSCALLDSYQVE
jgi:hypothetical protein